MHEHLQFVKEYFEIHFIIENKKLKDSVINERYKMIKNKEIFFKK